jgi:hypothetical protein
MELLVLRLRFVLALVVMPIQILSIISRPQSRGETVDQTMSIKSIAQSTDLFHTEYLLDPIEPRGKLHRVRQRMTIGGIGKSKSIDRLILFLRDIESPEQIRCIDEDRSIGDMLTGTDSDRQGSDIRPTYLARNLTSCRSQTGSVSCSCQVSSLPPRP